MTSHEPVPPSPELFDPSRQSAAETSGFFGRLLKPSFGDLLFILVIVFLFLAPPQGWQRLFLDGDTGLHIRTGDLILSTGSVPTTDPFSFSRPAGTWYAFEWGSEAIYSYLHSRTGLKGVALLTGVVLSATYAVLFLFSIWRGANGAISLVLALAAASATTIHFHARPHVFTLLLFTISLWMLERDRRRPDVWLWMLVPLATVWANLHGGFMMLLVALGLFFLGDWRETKRFPARLFMLGAASTLATLINPYGYRLHQHIVETMDAKWLIDLVDEFHSPSFRGEAMNIFMIALFGGLALLVPLTKQRRFREVFLILFLAWASLTSVRHAPLFLLAVLPIAALELTRLWTGAVASLDRRSAWRILDDVASKLSGGRAALSGWSCAFVVFLAMAPGLAWPTDFDRKLFPTKLVARQEVFLTAGRLFTTDQWNDYLVYRHYPRQRVFIDGRHNYYGEALVRDFSGLLQGAPTWRAILDRYRFDRALVPPEAAIASLLRTDPAWRVVDSDAQAVLFGRQAAEAKKSPEGPVLSMSSPTLVLKR
jgi:hypothetical protein